MQPRPHDDGLDDGLDLGPRRIKRGGERFCAATGAVTPVDDMIRFVVAPDGTVVPDLQRPDAEKIAIIATFATSQLDLAFGRANVVHAVLVAGPESEAFLARLARLERFRNGTLNRPENPGNWQRNG